MRLLALLAASGVVATAGCTSQVEEPPVPTVHLAIASNAIQGGKNRAEAEWLDQVIGPGFESQERSSGRRVAVTFTPFGGSDESYKEELLLDLKSGVGADVIALDGVWLAQFAEKGYLKPLSKVVGPEYVNWEGWSQIPGAVQQNVRYGDEAFGVPTGTDARVLFYNKTLFREAGLPDNWQPTSWDDILSAARALHQLPGVTPIQINSGRAMGEATTMQGFLPLLVGAGAQIYQDGHWQGDTPVIRKVLEFYSALFSGGLMSPDFALPSDARERSFAAFSSGKLGIILEGDYFWRSIINPSLGDEPMPSRDSEVGWALIPSFKPGSGIKSQSFVSMSGGSGFFLNPNTRNPEESWRFLEYLGSYQSTLASAGNAPRVTSRQDVNRQLFAKDNLLTFVTERALPLTAYRPGFAEYPMVSIAIQEATEKIATGNSVDTSAKEFSKRIHEVTKGALVNDDPPAR
jgi:multiple sugar transport system substrate-binding protein